MSAIYVARYTHLEQGNGENRVWVAYLAFDLVDGLLWAYLLPAPDGSEYLTTKGIMKMMGRDCVGLASGWGSVLFAHFLAFTCLMVTIRAFRAFLVARDG